MKSSIGVGGKIHLLAAPVPGPMPEPRPVPMPDPTPPPVPGPVPAEPSRPVPPPVPGIGAVASTFGTSIGGASTFACGTGSGGGTTCGGGRTGLGVGGTTTGGGTTLASCLDRLWRRRLDVLDTLFDAACATLPTPTAAGRSGPPAPCGPLLDKTCMRRQVVTSSRTISAWINVATNPEPRRSSRPTGMSRGRQGALTIAKAEDGSC